MQSTQREYTARREAKARERDRYNGAAAANYSSSRTIPPEHHGGRGNWCRPSAPAPSSKTTPHVPKAAKKRKASELDDENGGEIEKEKKTKVYCFILYARLRLLIYNVFDRELGATAPNSTQLPAVCLL